MAVAREAPSAMASSIALSSRTRPIMSAVFASGWTFRMVFTKSWLKDVKMYVPFAIFAAAVLYSLSQYCSMASGLHSFISNSTRNGARPANISTRSATEGGASPETLSLSALNSASVISATLPLPLVVRLTSPSCIITSSPSFVERMSVSKLVMP